jgi:hypothetical protein
MSRTSNHRWLAVVAVAMLSVSQPAAAQDARLSARLDAGTASAVEQIAQSARERGLPVEPLIQKALQGASKQASGDRIVQAVRSLYNRLDAARQIVGEGSESDLVSAAAALEAGATTTSLERLRAARREGEPMAPACLTLAFLVSKGVEPDRAADVLGDLLVARARDADFLMLQRLIDADVRAGAPPLEAARVRARGLLVAPIRRTP